MIDVFVFTRFYVAVIPASVKIYVMGIIFIGQTS
jgi:hypothetical protein